MVSKIEILEIRQMRMLVAHHFAAHPRAPALLPPANASECQNPNTLHAGLCLLAMLAMPTPDRPILSAGGHDVLHARGEQSLKPLPRPR